jgi:hypothetical protein
MGMNDAAFHNTTLPHLHKAADQIAKVLTAQYPPVPVPDSPHQGMVPAEGIENIAWALTEVVAQVLQSYLNAGSESDAIHEGLGERMEQEVKDWSSLAWDYAQED